MESESPLQVLSRAATMLHREETAAAESSYACTTNRAKALSLRCSAMEGTVRTVGKWKRERRAHRAVCSASSPVSPPQPAQPHYRGAQEPLDMTTTAGNGAPHRAVAATSSKEQRASVIIASSPPATAGHRATSASGGGTSDPVIDEHFRRSLGKDYMNVFAPAVARRERQRQQPTVAEPQNDAGLSAVDDHFAKALGDTWVKLQKEEYQKKRKETSAVDGGRQQKVNVYAA